MTKTFWKKKWGDKYCGITHGRLRPGKNKRGISYSVFLNCNHGFYRSVILEWAMTCYPNDATCPVCRCVFTRLD